MCQCLARKRHLNLVFDAMGLCYTDQNGPSTSLPTEEAAPRSHGARGRRVRGRKEIAGLSASTTALESRKRKGSS